MTNRNAARVAGVLFFCATVPFSVSVILLAPILGSSEYLTEVAFHSARVSAGAMLEVVNHVVVVCIAVVLYPILRPISARLALGYVAARLVEAVLFVIGTMQLWVLVDVSEKFVAAGTPTDSYFQTLGDVLLGGHDWDDAALAFTAFSIGALILNIVLYKARLVPRWLSIWGLAGAASILVSRLIVMSGVALSSSATTAFDTPIMLQELVFALWLVFKGFDEKRLQPEYRSNL